MGPDGKPTNSSDDRVTVDIVSLSGDSRIPVMVNCQEDGKYKVSYTPIYCGKYEVHVLVNSGSIAGSPRELTVSDNAPTLSSRVTTGPRVEGKLR